MYLSRNEEKYASINTLYKYVAILPCTQMKCERDFFSLNFTKTKCRSTLTQTNLENVMIISSEADMMYKVDLNNIIDEIALSSDQLSRLLF